MPSDPTNPPSAWAMEKARSIWPANLIAIARLIDSTVAEREKRWRKIADDLHFAYINKEPDCPHDFELSAVEAYQSAAKREGE